MSSFSFGAIYCPLRGLYWLDSSPMICGGFYAGASPRRSLRPKGIDLRGRWFAPAQNTLASTATHRQTNDSKKLLPFFVGLSIRPLRGLYWLGSSTGRRGRFFVGLPSLRCAVFFGLVRRRAGEEDLLLACPHSVARSLLAWFVDGQARSNLCRLVARCAILYYVRASGQINTRF